MDFYRTGNRGGRRRRLLVDDQLSQADPTDSADSGASQPQTEDSSASVEPLLEQLPRIIDLFPRRWVTLCLLFCSGLLVILGLEALYYYTQPLAAMTSDGKIEAFDLDTEGSLAVWFSSMTLAFAAFASLGLYSIGKRYINDYRARYRIWLWAAGCWMLMSIDETGSLHEGFKELMSVTVQSRVFGDGSIWWVLAYLCLLLPVGAILWLEMRKSQFARGFFSATAVCYAVAVLAQLQFILPDSGARGVMVEEGAEMLGNWMLLFAIIMQARVSIRQICEHDQAQATVEATSEAPVEEKKPTRRRRSSGATTSKASTTKSTAKRRTKTAESESETSAKSTATETDEPKPKATSEKPTKSDEDDSSVKKTSPKTKTDEPATSAAPQKTESKPNMEVSLIAQESKSATEDESQPQAEPLQPEQQAATEAKQDDSTEANTSQNPESESLDYRLDDPESLLESSGTRRASKKQRRKERARRR